MEIKAKVRYNRENGRIHKGSNFNCNRSCACVVVMVHWPTISDFNKAIEINPKYADACNNRGSAYYSKGEYGPAIFDYDKAIAMNPRLVGAYLNKARACESADRKQEAIEAYKAFVNLTAGPPAFIEQVRRSIQELEQ